MTLRPEPPDQQPSIELHIEELLLHGVPLTRGQASEVQAAVETELARLLTEQGISRSFADGASNLSAGSIRMTPDSKPAHLGHQVAQAIYGGLTPTPVSPPTRASEGASG